MIHRHNYSKAVTKRGSQSYLHTIRRAFFSYLLLFVAQGGGGYPLFAKEDLAAVLKPLIDAHQGEVTVMVEQCESGDSYAYRADKPMPTASLIKFPLMVAAYQAVADGKLSLEQPIVLQKEDKVPGSGILTPHFSEGATISLADAIHLMMVYSDNTATNLVIDQVGLPATAELMKKLDCPNTLLHSKVFRRDTSIFPERSKQYGLGSTTAREMVRLLASLQSGRLVSETASKQMLAHMFACESRSKFPRLLPPGTKIAHKGGSVSASRASAGIIESPSGPIAVCVMTTDNEDRSWSDENAADLLCSHIAREAYNFFNPDQRGAQSATPQVLKVGAGGKLVESLQRTLNARLKPSPGLGVDGDFGPATQRAVLAFQRFKGLEETGEVGPKMWAALGTLVDKDPDAPDPDEVNSREWIKQPADTLSGPPFVTCKAWAIGDAKTGELLWGFEEDTVRDIASTTKMMTAYLVTSLAEKNPEILDEVVVFSKRADETGGSTAGIRAGERVSVRDLLYGLMLPSGNDASMALAEHFGSRLGDASGNAETAASYDQFIAAMNRMADRLGMHASGFENPNGLPQKGHHATARDLLILAYNAMQQPLFRKYVSTPERGSTVTGAEGYKRNVVWKGTNRLLRIEGFDGIKTGTTNAAGSCLVSRGSRGDRSLIVVVLGATSTDARYVDSRNLYRWAWHELGFRDNTEQ